MVVLTGESLYNKKTPAECAYDFLNTDLDYCMTAIDQRVEQQCAQRMSTGRIDMLGLGGACPEFSVSTTFNHVCYDTKKEYITMDRDEVIKLAKEMSLRLPILKTLEDLKDILPRP